MHTSQFRLRPFAQLRPMLRELRNKVEVLHKELEMIQYTYDLKVQQNLLDKSILKSKQLIYELHSAKKCMGLYKNKIHSEFDRTLLSLMQHGIKNLEIDCHGVIDRLQAFSLPSHLSMQPHLTLGTVH